jgi:hypothetical protein
MAKLKKPGPYLMNQIDRGGFNKRLEFFHGGEI